MALSFVNKTKSGTVLLVVSLTVALGGWFGYTAWKEAARETAEWRLANDDMQRLLIEQSEQRVAQNGAAGRNDTKTQTTTKNSPDSKEAGSKPTPLEQNSQAASTAATNKESSQSTEQPTISTATTESTPVPVSSSTAASSKDSRLNINKATEKELDTLPGIGESKAKAIVAYREKLGGRFKSVDQLKDVKGIGDKLLAKMKPYITVDP
ncbi:helix-hairpin-helix domain-containing protein [Paenibacillus sp. RC67]|uniref:ComEA family DNA-binding protein n=1 Tax=Paenibacillus sp. RC67 TaxID=3039392 RepID=UPI0024AE01CA|nr:helix-hairpin-helix domain-containing protein [Paenibacillus sp. RC67]